jgi:uncharacterized protein with NAD-binding domain and iron-sulfur cluster
LLTTEQDKQSYETGFHIFPSRENAISLLMEIESYAKSINMSVTIRKVHYKNVMAKGTQRVWNTAKWDYLHVPCIVAKEILVEPVEG